MLSEYSIKQIDIMYCFDKCCNAGYNIVPQTVVSYNFDDDWIIASNRSGKDRGYWIFNKSSFLAEKDINDQIKANLIGPIDSLAFYNYLSEQNIELELITYIK